MAWWDDIDIDLDSISRPELSEDIKEHEAEWAEEARRDTGSDDIYDLFNSWREDVNEIKTDWNRVNDEIDDWEEDWNQEYEERQEELKQTATSGASKVATEAVKNTTTTISSALADLSGPVEPISASRRDTISSQLSTLIDTKLLPEQVGKVVETSQERLDEITKQVQSNLDKLEDEYEEELNVKVKEADISEIADKIKTNLNVLSNNTANNSSELVNAGIASINNITTQLKSQLESAKSPREVDFSKQEAIGVTNAIKALTTKTVTNLNSTAADAATTTKTRVEELYGVSIPTKIKEFLDGKRDMSGSIDAVKTIISQQRIELDDILDTAVRAKVGIEPEPIAEPKIGNFTVSYVNELLSKGRDDAIGIYAMLNLSDTVNISSLLDDIPPEFRAEATDLLVRERIGLSDIVNINDLNYSQRVLLNSIATKSLQEMVPEDVTIFESPVAVMAADEFVGITKPVYNYLKEQGVSDPGLALKHANDPTVAGIVDTLGAAKEGEIELDRGAVVILGMSANEQSDLLDRINDSVTRFIGREGTAGRDYINDRFSKTTGAGLSNTELQNYLEADPDGLAKYFTGEGAYRVKTNAGEILIPADTEEALETAKSIGAYVAVAQGSEIEVTGELDGQFGQVLGIRGQDIFAGAKETPGSRIDYMQGRENPDGTFTEEGTGLIYAKKSTYVPPKGTDEEGKTVTMWVVSGQDTSGLPQKADFGRDSVAVDRTTGESIETPVGLPVSSTMYGDLTNRLALKTMQSIGIDPNNVSPAIKELFTNAVKISEVDTPTKTPITADTAGKEESWISRNWAGTRGFLDEKTQFIQDAIGLSSLIETRYDNLEKEGVTEVTGLGGVIGIGQELTNKGKSDSENITRKLSSIKSLDEYTQEWDSITRGEELQTWAEMALTPEDAANLVKSNPDVVKDISIKNPYVYREIQNKAIEYDPSTVTELQDIANSLSLGEAATGVVNIFKDTLTSLGVDPVLSGEGLTEALIEQGVPEQYAQYTGSKLSTGGNLALLPLAGLFKGGVKGAVKVGGDVIPLGMKNLGVSGGALSDGVKALRTGDTPTATKKASHVVYAMGGQSPDARAAVKAGTTTPETIAVGKYVIGNINIDDAKKLSDTLTDKNAARTMSESLDKAAGLGGKTQPELKSLSLDEFKKELDANVDEVMSFTPSQIVNTGYDADKIKAFIDHNQKLNADLFTKQYISEVPAESKPLVENVIKGQKITSQDYDKLQKIYDDLPDEAKQSFDSASYNAKVTGAPVASRVADIKFIAESTPLEVKPLDVTDPKALSDATLPEVTAAATKDKDVLAWMDIKDFENLVIDLDDASRARILDNIRTTRREELIRDTTEGLKGIPTDAVKEDILGEVTSLQSFDLIDTTADKGVYSATKELYDIIYRQGYSSEVTDALKTRLARTDEGTEILSLFDEIGDDLKVVDPQWLNKAPQRDVVAALDSAGGKRILGNIDSSDFNSIVKQVPDADKVETLIKSRRTAKNTVDQADEAESVVEKVTKAETPKEVEEVTEDISKLVDDAADNPEVAEKIADIPTTKSEQVKASLSGTAKVEYENIVGLGKARTVHKTQTGESIYKTVNKLVKDGDISKTTPQQLSMLSRSEFNTMMKVNKVTPEEFAEASAKRLEGLIKQIEDSPSAKLLTDRDWAIIYKFKSGDLLTSDEVGQLNSLASKVGRTRLRLMLENAVPGWAKSHPILGSAGLALSFIFLCQKYGSEVAFAMFIIEERDQLTSFSLMTAANHPMNFAKALAGGLVSRGVADKFTNWAVARFISQDNAVLRFLFPTAGELYNYHEIDAAKYLQEKVREAKQTGVWICTEKSDGTCEESYTYTVEAGTAKGETITIEGFGRPVASEEEYIANLREHPECLAYLEPAAYTEYVGKLGWTGEEEAQHFLDGDLPGTYYNLSQEARIIVDEIQKETLPPDLKSGLVITAGGSVEISDKAMDDYIESGKSLDNDWNKGYVQDKFKDPSGRWEGDELYKVYSSEQLSGYNISKNPGAVDALIGEAYDRGDEDTLKKIFADPNLQDGAINELTVEQKIEFGRNGLINEREWYKFTDEEQFYMENDQIPYSEDVTGLEIVTDEKIPLDQRRAYLDSYDRNIDTSDPNIVGLLAAMGVIPQGDLWEYINEIGELQVNEIGARLEDQGAARSYYMNKVESKKDTPITVTPLKWPAPISPIGKGFNQTGFGDGQYGKSPVSGVSTGVDVAPPAEYDLLNIIDDNPSLITDLDYHDQLDTWASVDPEAAIAWSDKMVKESVNSSYAYNSLPTDIQSSLQKIYDDSSYYVDEDGIVTTAEVDRANGTLKWTDPLGKMHYKPLVENTTQKYNTKIYDPVRDRMITKADIARELKIPIDSFEIDPTQYLRYVAGDPGIKPGSWIVYKKQEDAKTSYYGGGGGGGGSSSSTKTAYSTGQTGLFVDTSGTPADIYLDGVFVGNSGSLIAVPPGQYEMKVVATGKNPKTQYVSIYTGRITNQTIYLSDRWYNICDYVDSAGGVTEISPTNFVHIYSLYRGWDNAAEAAEELLDPVPLMIPTAEYISRDDVKFIYYLAEGYYADAQSLIDSGKVCEGGD